MDNNNNNNNNEEGDGERKKLLLPPRGGAPQHQYGSTPPTTLMPAVREQHYQASGQPTSPAVSMTLPAFDEEDDEEGSSSDDDDDDDDDEQSESRFHLGRPGLITQKNMWTSKRLTESFMEYGGAYDIVPTLHRDNLALVLDPNLGPRDNGTLYYAQQAFYRSDEEPEYVITVNPSIYQRIVKEISDSRSVPCGLYYFCHEGDGAQAGASKDDHVDILLAWTFLTAVFAAMMLLSVVGTYDDS